MDRYPEEQIRHPSLPPEGRKKRPSADFYAEICRENGLSADMVARYAPEVFAQLFPN